MATRWGRVLRGLVASTIAVFVAAFAHVIAGGSVPDLGGLALAFAFSALASIALAGRTVSRVRIGASVILSQGVFHLLFDLTATAHVAAATHTMGMNMGGTMPTVTTTPLMLADGWMWLAHGVAAAITIVALAWGERAFWGLLESVRLALTLALRMTGVRAESARPSEALASSAWTLAAIPAVCLDAGLWRRGPPAASIASR
jgi:hypothetical protein